MSASHVRHGVGAVRPYLHGPLSLLDFLERAFGAEELERYAFSDEAFHVHLGIGDAVVMVEAGALPEQVSPWTGSVYVYVPDVDAVWAEAMASGMAPVSEPEDKPYGERQCGFRDSAGNTWWVGTYRGPAEGV